MSRRDEDAGGGLRAVEAPFEAGHRLLARCEDARARGDFANSPAWIRAAEDALGHGRIAHVILLDARTGEPVGHLALERSRADWRSGQPGRPTLTWPFGDVGYGFAPRWLGPARPNEWLPAIGQRYAGLRIFLPRTAPDAAAGAPEGFECAEGAAVWAADPAPTAAGWKASLVGKHRRELDRYRREIARRGGEWVDCETADPCLMDACFSLHAARMRAKGKPQAILSARAETFLRALARRTERSGLRLTMLKLEGRFAAACLSFVHRGRLKAFVSGWDRLFRDLDLGRQVLHHQILREFERGLSEIDFLGGDLDYKREFGLQRRPTAEFIAHGGILGRLCARTVGTALGAYRRIRRPQGVR
ncbi:MAG: hypothetical protein Fur0037_27310 [Planctomycetota bacterium]